MTTATDRNGVLGVAGTRFTLDGAPFPFTGISFFNAIYNPAFHASREARLGWLRTFKRYGIDVLRVWGQWDSKRGFVDTAPGHTLVDPDGHLAGAHVERLEAILEDARGLGMVVELAVYAQESWHDGIRHTPEAAERGVRALSQALRPHRNLAIQIWNELSEHTLPLARAVKEADPARLVTNSPGGAAVLLAPPGRGELERLLDFLTPHTSRQRSGPRPHWEVAPQEIAYLLARFGKPVVDDEPARNGTSDFGGPDRPTSPYDQILQIQAVWRAGGHVVYHHDMFQTGYGTPAIPPSGIPEPEFNPYHRQVLEFIAQGERYRNPA
jgi:hypothetical protein